ncbi:MAG: hypothetical protein IGR76_16910, partial [Synechococcales cyanobacterium T60_A2020_003]|nr:hypothetical protein [Synechococcales cyanobacterium T60_A2020_003]
WVTTDDLWRAMNTIDSTSNLTRGFVLITSPEGDTTAATTGE